MLVLCLWFVGVVGPMMHHHSKSWPPTHNTPVDPLPSLSAACSCLHHADPSSGPLRSSLASSPGLCSSSLSRVPPTAPTLKSQPPRVKGQGSDRTQQHRRFGQRKVARHQLRLIAHFPSPTMPCTFVATRQRAANKTSLTYGCSALQGCQGTPAAVWVRQRLTNDFSAFEVSRRTRMHIHHSSAAWHHDGA